MSRIKLDLKQFSHVKSDDKTTTLRHKHGHELTIYRKALSPEAQEQLGALAPKKMADGGLAGVQAQNPCLNPKCKSHGKPHPNCRCWGPMAKGGEAKSFCSSDQMHDEGCEYYAKGGDILDSGSEGESAQGKAVRWANKDKEHHASHMKGAKEEAKGRAQHEREFVKPDIKGMADGGSVPDPINKRGETTGITSAPPTSSTPSKKTGLNQPVSGVSGADISKPSTWWADGGEVADKDGRKMYAEGTKDNYVSQSPDDKPANGMPDININLNGQPIGANQQPQQAQPQQAPDFRGVDANGKPPEQSGQGGRNFQGQDANQFAQAQQQAQPPQSPDQQPGWSVGTPVAPAQDMDASSPAPAQDSSQPAAPDASAGAPQTDSSEPAAPPKPKTPEEHFVGARADMLNEAQATSQDLTDGHITPKTYSDLFHYKNGDKTQGDTSTLSKIGTLFGMLASGAGSGLAHQPNMLLEMMNKEIERDTAAQIQSKTNAQNLYKLNQENLRNQAAIKHENASSALIDAQAKALTISQKQRFALDQETRKMQALPEGSPERKNMENAYALMYQAINTNDFNVFSRLAAAKALSSFGQQPGQGTEQGFQQRNKSLEMAGMKDMAQYEGQRHFPGIQGNSTDPLDKTEVERLRGHQEFDRAAKSLQDFVSSHGGVWDHLKPNDKALAAQLVLPIQSAFRENTLGSVYKAGEQPLLDKAVNGQPLDLAQYFMGTEKKKLAQLRNTNSQQYNLFKGQLGFPKDQNSQQSSSQNNTQDAARAWAKANPGEKANQILKAIGDK